MIIKQYRDTAADLKHLTQRILTPAHSIIGRYKEDAVKVTFTDPLTLDCPLPLFESAPPLSAYEEGLDHAGLYKNGRLLYYVGGVYTVMHKRGKPAVRVFWPNGNDILGAPVIVAPDATAEGLDYDRRGWKPLKIEVVRIRFGRLQAMTDDDVIAEGVHSREEYITLWNSINGSGAWGANPLVARIGFKVWGKPDKTRLFPQPPRRDRRVT